MTKSEREAIQQRILALCEKPKRGKKGCWVWTGAKAWSQGSKTPYGYMWVSGKKAMARRLAYEAWGKKPALGTRVVKSTCGNSLCVNPDHLERGLMSASRGRA